MFESWKLNPAILTDVRTTPSRGIKTHFKCDQIAILVEKQSWDLHGCCFSLLNHPFGTIQYSLQ